MRKGNLIATEESMVVVGGRLSPSWYTWWEELSSFTFSPLGISLYLDGFDKRLSVQGCLSGMAFPNIRASELCNGRFWADQANDRETNSQRWRNTTYWLVEGGNGGITPEDRASKKVAEEVAEGDGKSLSSSEFDDVFNLNYLPPSTWSCKTKGDSSLKVLGILAY